MLIPKYYATIGAHSININAEFFLLLFSYLFLLLFYLCLLCRYSLCECSVLYLCSTYVLYTVKRRLELLIHINGKLGWFWLASDDNEDFSGGDMVVAVLGTPHGHQSATQKYHERHRTQHPAKLSANCFSFCLLFRRVALAAQYTTMSKK